MLRSTMAPRRNEAPRQEKLKRGRRGTDREMAAKQAAENRSTTVETRGQNSSGAEARDSFYCVCGPTEVVPLLQNHVRLSFSAACLAGERDWEIRRGEMLEFELSRWSRSRAKRIVDVLAVLACSPIFLPLLALIGAAVFVTSGLPVIFLQVRMGRGGVPFAIYKFRTMRPSRARGGSAMAVESASRITWLGSLLRRTKLDELPQVFNVLLGDMSLVGPRPKVLEQQLQPLWCRPGLTGAATLAFAREESFLMQFPPEEWAALFDDAILPAKRRMDAQYMQSATVWSDLRILADTILFRWKTHAQEIQQWGDAESCEAPSSQTASLCS